MFANLIVLLVPLIIANHRTDARVLAQTRDVLEYGIGFDFTPSYA